MTNIKKNHSERKHALLSASGSSRWMACTPSARLEENFGNRETSVYAEEGTIAHELAELMLRRDVLDEVTEEQFDERLSELMNKDLFNDEMFDVIPIYTDYCVEQFNEAKLITSDALFNVEQRIDFSAYVEDGFGMCDTTIISDRVLEVVDLKYGKGVAVSAIANKQLMLYGLGALTHYDTAYDIHTVRLTIVQPRINNISSWEIEASKLIDWAENELSIKAKLAFAGEGELNPGEHCRFCSVKNRCEALARENLEIAKHEFKEPMLLTDDEIAEIVRKVPMLIEWANSIHDYALQKAVQENKHWPGFKLVEGSSRRKWVDEQLVIERIVKNIPEFSDEDIYNMKLKSITEIEKALGKKKFAQLLGEVVIKPQGKPSLVSEDDRRPALGVEQAKSDFE